MQIHELNKPKVQQQNRQGKPAPVTGLDTSKVSPHIAAQIKNSEQGTITLTIDSSCSAPASDGVRTIFPWGEH